MSKEKDEAQKGKPAPLTGSLLERKGSASPSGFEAPTITPIVIRAAQLTPRPSNEENGLASDSSSDSAGASDSGGAISAEPGDVPEPVVGEVRASDLREIFFESGSAADTTETAPEATEPEPEPAGDQAAAEESLEAGEGPLFTPDPEMGRKATDRATDRATDWATESAEDREAGAGNLESPEAAGDDEAGKPDPLFEMRFAEFMPGNEAPPRVATSRRRIVIVSSIATIIAVLMAVVWSYTADEISPSDQARPATARTGIKPAPPTPSAAPAEPAPAAEKPAAPPRAVAEKQPAKPAPVAESEAKPKAEAAPAPETVTEVPTTAIPPPPATPVPAAPAAETVAAPPRQMAETPPPAPAPETIPAPPETVAETAPPAPPKQVADTPPAAQTVAAPPKQVAETAPAPTPKPASEAAPRAVAENPPAAEQPSAPPEAVAERSPAPPKPAPPKPAAPKSGSEPAGAQTAAVPPPPSPGAYLVQLSSLRSAAAANREWSRLLRAHSGILGGHALIVQRAEIKGRGTYFRVRTGGFESSRAARDFCAQLKARKQGCLVVKR